MVLTIEDVAVRLNIPVETVNRWVRQGKIPMQSDGGRYIIRTAMFERWAEEHRMQIHAPAAAKAAADEAAADLVLPAMTAGGVFYDVPARDKDHLLAEAVARIPNLDDGHRPLILEKLTEREQLASTGIGYGIALPHPRANPEVPLERPQITTCFTADPVAFDAVDRHPVSVVMVLLSNTTKEHLSLLSKLAFFLRDAGFRDRLLSAPPQDAFFELIAEMESANPNL